MALIIEETGKKKLSENVNLMVQKFVCLTKNPFIYLLEKAFKLLFILGMIGTNNKNKISVLKIFPPFIWKENEKSWKICICFSFYSLITVPLSNFTKVFFVIKIQFWKNKIFSEIFNNFIFKSKGKRYFFYTLLYFENPLNRIKKVLCFFYTFFI